LNNVKISFFNVWIVLNRIDMKISNKILGPKLLALGTFIFLLLANMCFAAEEGSESTLLPIYDTQTQKLSIPKLGVPSGQSGYAYKVEMALYTNEPLGFIVTSMGQPVSITADESISAIYRAETHSIYFPRVYIIDENSNISEITQVSLAISGDPFVWFYSAQ